MPEVRLIDANALTDKMDIMISDAILADTAISYALIRELVAEQPTIEAEPVRHGRWISVSSFDAYGGDEEAWMAHGNPTAYHYCSECKNEAYANEEGKEILSDYCPFCGTDMREEGADNDS